LYLFCLTRIGTIRNKDYIQYLEEFSWQGFFRISYFYALSTYKLQCEIFQMKNGFFPNFVV